jgi:hypothetical protein
MTEAALQLYKSAQEAQHSRNEARRIRTRVNEARQNPHPAAIRWPFELIQNALDAGPSSGNTTVAIRVIREASKVTFEHNGAPFTSGELAALLSGGSSKEFESEITTGRFGTGFLVTHVLSENTTISGILNVVAGYERFILRLNRAGDEDSILSNIQECGDAIRNAECVSDLHRIPSAKFEYFTDDTDGSFEKGLESLRETLPYLFATRPTLGQVSFEVLGSDKEIWIGGDVTVEALEEGYAEIRSIQVEGPDRKPMLAAYRFTTTQDAPASAIVLTDCDEDARRVLLPKPGAPRVFREYPIRGSGFVPIELVLDGKFEPTQERDRILMNESDKALITEGLSAAVIAVKYAASHDWNGGHLLGRTQKPATAFDTTNAAEPLWWVDQLSFFATRVAQLPIIKCGSRLLPAIDSAEHDWFADFVIPRFSPASPENETTIERMWPLLDAANDLAPPSQELAADWTEIAEGWHTLGLKLGRVTLTELIGYVTEDVAAIAELRVTGEAYDWLASFLDVVGECWQRRGSADASILSKALPNQERQLSTLSSLSRDRNIPERLKDISLEVGLNLRSRLLSNELETAAEKLRLLNVSKVLEQSVFTSISEEDAAKDIVRHLSDEFPEDEDYETEKQNLRNASVLFLDYLWGRLGAAGRTVARQMPLMSSGARAVRWSPDRMMMAPVANWHPSARPFASAYPPNRVLADIYKGHPDEGIPDVTFSLVEWGIAIADPITTTTQAELRDNRLKAISLSDDDLGGVVVADETFSQLALVQDVLNRCRENRDHASALLGLTLCHFAPHDPAWQETRVVTGRRARDDVEVSIRGALWLADLRYRAWVPVLDEDGGTQHMLADVANIKELLVPAWLEQNESAIKLLNEIFGFDELELRLLGIPDEKRRQELRNELARLVEIGGADTNFYTTLIEQVESQQRRHRDINRCMRMGLAIQEAVKLALESYNLKLTLVDYGFDYEVSAEDVIEDGASNLGVGPYLLEIKATTTGKCRLTPTQALTASTNADIFVLCCVDLRGVSEDRLEDEWEPVDVEPLARIVCDLGGRIGETYDLVDAARDCEVNIRNESALRYEVSEDIWQQGIMISQWVEEISQKLKPIVAK